MFSFTHRNSKNRHIKANKCKAIIIEDDNDKKKKKKHISATLKRLVGILTLEKILVNINVCVVILLILHSCRLIVDTLLQKQMVEMLLYLISNLYVKIVIQVWELKIWKNSSKV